MSIFSDGLWSDPALTPRHARSHEAAKPKRPAIDAPVQAPMRPREAGQKAPSTDQKKTRRAMAQGVRKSAAIPVWEFSMPGRDPADLPFFVEDPSQIPADAVNPRLNAWHSDSWEAMPYDPEAIRAQSATSARKTKDDDEDLYYDEEPSEQQAAYDDENPPMRQSGSKKEPPMTQPTEAQILAAMTVATPAERARLVASLDDLRASRRDRVAQTREVDLANTVVTAHLTPVAVHERVTAETDWLGSIATPSLDPTVAMKTAATNWYRKVSAEVKADREEFGIQAQGAARRQAGAFGEQMPAAQRAFLDHVARMYQAEPKTANDAVDPQNGYADSKAVHYDDLDPVTDTPAFAETGWKVDDDKTVQSGGYDGDDDGGTTAARRGRHLAGRVSCAQCDGTGTLFNGAPCAACGGLGYFVVNDDTHPIVAGVENDQAADKDATNITGLDSMPDTSTFDDLGEPEEYGDRDYDGADEWYEKHPEDLAKPWPPVRDATASRRTSALDWKDYGDDGVAANLPSGSIGWAIVADGGYGFGVDGEQLGVRGSMIDAQNAVEGLAASSPSNRMGARKIADLDTQIKLLEQNIAQVRASMAWETDKDQARRRIKSMQDRLKDLKSQKSGARKQADEVDGPVNAQNGLANSSLEQVDVHTDTTPAYSQDGGLDLTEPGRDAADVASVPTPGQDGYPQPKGASRKVADEADGPLLWSGPNNLGIPWTKYDPSPDEVEKQRLFPDGIPLRGDLTPEQQAWMNRRGSTTAAFRARVQAGLRKAAETTGFPEYDGDESWGVSIPFNIYPLMQDQQGRPFSQESAQVFADLYNANLDPDGLTDHPATVVNVRRVQAGLRKAADLSDQQFAALSGGPVEVYRWNTGEVLATLPNPDAAWKWLFDHSIGSVSAAVENQGMFVRDAQTAD